ncbi:MAG: DM13 domain-containing protein [Leptolyngbyaceae cyanobacterium SL_1_1]|nr:DM13 domain-containing protein [Leptolyngbyaceae cyanobacterium RM1_1_2]NJO11014.1 DM13 domain-containing protein [Leptolyngbyaceae cyanobacterium SL_1_1]
MGALSGTDKHSTSGSVGAAIFGGGEASLAFKDFQTDAEADVLQAYLTIRGNFSKRVVELGELPQKSGSFELALPANTDISLHNTVVIRPQGSDEVIGTATIP